jgi:beta-glucosidase
MVHRILRSMFAKGVVDHPPVVSPLDVEADAAVATRAAEQGMVLLKNRSGLLPLDRGLKRIAVIGAHADAGVLSGGGSSRVVPVGGNAVPGLGPNDWTGPITYLPSPPLAAVRRLLRDGRADYADGADPQAAARLARDADAAVVFVHQWATESLDAPDLSLPDRQDDLVAAVVAANPRTVVVLETGGPVLMPWLDKAGAVMEAWYPGAGGGEAIARLLFGEVNPSGHLPVTFPRSEEQLPRPTIPGVRGATVNGPNGPYDLNVDYSEGAAVGYKWFRSRNLTPLFPFGFGLSYTDFAYGGLSAEGGAGLTVGFDVTNTGARAGMDVPQLYLDLPDGTRRLIGWSKLDLKPGETRRVSVTADPRLLAGFDEAAGRWRIAGGVYTVAVATSAQDPRETATVTLDERSFGP